MSVAAMLSARRVSEYNGGGRVSCLQQITVKRVQPRWAKTGTERRAGSVNECAIGDG